jgi:hypothetical protein
MKNGKLKTVVMKYDCDPEQGVAGFILGVRMEGYEVLSMDRKGKKAAVIYQACPKKGSNEVRIK